MKLTSLVYSLLIVLLTSTAYAQVKVGTNPGTIGSTSNLEVEATNGNKTSVNKSTGQVTIVDGTQGNFKILTSDANGNSSWQNLSAQPGYLIQSIKVLNGLIIPPNTNITSTPTAVSAATAATTLNGVSYTYRQLSAVAGTVTPPSSTAPRTVIEYSFTQNILPDGAIPDAVFLTPQNNLGYPDNFSVNLISKTANKLTVSITRTDITAGNGFGWAGTFLLDIMAINL